MRKINYTAHSLSLLVLSLFIRMGGCLVEKYISNNLHYVSIEEVSNFPVDLADTSEEYFYHKEPVLIQLDSNYYNGSPVNPIPNGWSYQKIELNLFNLSGVPIPITIYSCAPDGFKISLLQTRPKDYFDQTVTYFQMVPVNAEPYLEECLYRRTSEKHKCLCNRKSIKQNEFYTTDCLINNTSPKKEKEEIKIEKFLVRKTHTLIKTQVWHERIHQTRTKYIPVLSGFILKRVNIFHPASGCIIHTLWIPTYHTYRLEEIVQYDPVQNRTVFLNFPMNSDYSCIDIRSTRNIISSKILNRMIHLENMRNHLEIEISEVYRYGTFNNIDTPSKILVGYLVATIPRESHFVKIHPLTPYTSTTGIVTHYLYKLQKIPRTENTPIHQNTVRLSIDSTYSPMHSMSSMVAINQPTHQIMSNPDYSSTSHQMNNPNIPNYTSQLGNLNYITQLGNSNYIFQMTSPNHQITSNPSTSQLSNPSTSQLSNLNYTSQLSNPNTAYPAYPSYSANPTYPAYPSYSAYPANTMGIHPDIIDSNLIAQNMPVASNLFRVSDSANTSQTGQPVSPFYLAISQSVGQSVRECSVPGCTYSAPAVSCPECVPVPCPDSTSDSEYSVPAISPVIAMLSPVCSIPDSPYDTTHAINETVHPLSYPATDSYAYAINTLPDSFNQNISTNSRNISTNSRNDTNSRNISRNSMNDTNMPSTSMNPSTSNSLNNPSTSNILNDMPSTNTNPITNPSAFTPYYST